MKNIKKNYTWLNCPHTFQKLGKPNHGFVYCLIDDWLSKNKECFISNDYISQRLFLSTRQVKRIVKELEQMQYIKTHVESMSPNNSRRSISYGSVFPEKFDFAYDAKMKERVTTISELAPAEPNTASPQVKTTPPETIPAGMYWCKAENKLKRKKRSILIM
jgi:hypothetical protein